LLTAREQVLKFANIAWDESAARTARPPGLALSERPCSRACGSTILPGNSSELRDGWKLSQTDGNLNSNQIGLMERTRIATNVDVNRRYRPGKKRMLKLEESSSYKIDYMPSFGV